MAQHCEHSKFTVDLEILLMAELNMDWAQIHYSNSNIFVPSDTSGQPCHFDIMYLQLNV